MIDVNEQINTVARTVGTRTLEAGEARVVTLSRTYKTDIEDLWDACTSIDRIPRWFAPVTGELKLGGHYQVEGNAGGTIERCDPPTGFDATWEMGGDISWVKVQLTAESAGVTRFHLEHVAHVGDERWIEFGPGAVGVGWELGVLGLQQHLEAEPGTAVAGPEAGALWAASEDGKRFMALSSERWAAASIEAGADEAAAQAAAARTTAFYTGD